MCQIVNTSVTIVNTNVKLLICVIIVNKSVTIVNTSVTIVNTSVTIEFNLTLTIPHMYGMTLLCTNILQCIFDNLYSVLHKTSTLVPP